MISYGTPPFLECSSKGDTRFSAFYARIRARGNKSIEDIYQAAKVFEDGSTGLGWREAKGKRASNMAEVTELYGALWDEFIAENPHLKSVLKAASGLSDRFGQTGHCCQATELWRIRGRILNTANDRPPEQAPAASSQLRQEPLFEQTGTDQAPKKVEPKAKTAEEVRAEFLKIIRQTAKYWADHPDVKTTQERCDGLAHSILSLIDGSIPALPAMNISLAPHEDDKELLRSEGSNWFEPGMVINDCELAGMYFRETSPVASAARKHKL